MLYTSLETQTSIVETIYHWINDNADLVRDIGFLPSSERLIYRIEGRALLLDLVDKKDEMPQLVSETYGYCQDLGRRIHREGLPGLIAPSARLPEGTNVCIFRIGAVSDFSPHERCVYEFLNNGRVFVSFRSVAYPPGIARREMSFPLPLA